MGEGKSEKKVQEASIDTKLLYQRLIKMEIGEFISYAELSDIIGSPIQNARGFLYTAIKMAEKEDGKTFGCVINEGYKCLTPSEIISTGARAISHVKNTTTRTARRFRCIADIGTLENGERIRYNTNLSILGMMKEMTRPHNVKKIENKVTEVKELLPYAKTLEAFK